MEKLFAFHGVDHKVGVTMVAQSVAEVLAHGRKDLKVLLITLNGRKNKEYVKENVDTIDDYKMRMDSKLIISKDFAASTRKRENLHMLAGLMKEEEERYYFPDSASYLLEAIEDQFDIIISDTGSEIDNGLALGGLTVAGSKFLVLTQLESSLKRFENQKERYQTAGIRFEHYLVNKFEEKDPYGISYLSKRLNIGKDQILKIQNAEYSRQAEMEYKSLVEFQDSRYKSDIHQIANHILRKNGHDSISTGKKTLWKNFI